MEPALLPLAAAETTQTTVTAATASGCASDASILTTSTITTTTTTTTTTTCAELAGPAVVSASVLQCGVCYAAPASTLDGTCESCGPSGCAA